MTSTITTGGKTAGKRDYMDKTYCTLREAVTAAFARVKSDQVLFDGIDYWAECDLMDEADAREVSDIYTVKRNGTIYIGDHVLYRPASVREAEVRTPLAAHRHFSGLTQAQLADKVAAATGTSRATMIRKIQCIESGKIKLDNVSLRIALALADALEVDPHELLDDDNPIL